MDRDPSVLGDVEAAVTTDSVESCPRGKRGVATLSSFWFGVVGLCTRGREEELVGNPSTEIPT